MSSFLIKYAPGLVLLMIPGSILVAGWIDGLLTSWGI